jgi:predicted molibdopterin-dependent oxidoreductase YjgC
MDRLDRVRRGRQIAIEVDGERVECWEGETVATAMLTRRLRLSRDASRPRSLFCGIGVCFECVAEIDGTAGVRTCMTLAVAGMSVHTASGGPAGA